MVTPRLSRVFLIALLPLIALALYVEGQRYDPALIRFAPSDINTSAEAALFPGETEGFNLAGQVRVFTKDNLYEYVNGHAEYFLSAGFVGLTVGEYILAGTDSTEPDVVVDIFDMGRPIQAFGVFADEAGDGSATASAGIVESKTQRGISFAAGKYYVKITVFRDDVPVDMFAARIQSTIGRSREDVTVFSRLPDVGETVSTRFVKEAYRGLGFASNVIEREYRIRGNRVQVSFVTGSHAQMMKLLESYLVFFRESDIEYVKMHNGGQEVYKIIDPYEGDWYLVPLADAVFGIYGVTDGEALNQFVASIMERAAAEPE